MFVCLSEEKITKNLFLFWKQFIAGYCQLRNYFKRGGETGYMYVLSYQVLCYRHIYVNLWYVHVPWSVIFMNLVHVGMLG